MAYPTKNGEPVYRSSDLDEVQGYDDLRMIWRYVRMSGKGKTAPLSERAKAKIAKGLELTMSEGKSSRTRLVAGAMALAIADGDWDRDVTRKPTKGAVRMGRTSRAKGEGSGGSGGRSCDGDAKGQDERCDAREKHG